MYGNVKLISGEVQVVQMTRYDWKRHAPYIKEINNYQRQVGKSRYTGYAALDLIAKWVLHERYESECDSQASQRFDAYMYGND
jgi:hypothetical protein